MAKALFHKGQRVYIKPVGTWAIVENVIPSWAKGVEEPIRVNYDVGFGREFTAAEIVSEAIMYGRSAKQQSDDLVLENWRVFRLKSRWADNDNSEGHPYPGTFPVIMTDENDWGGWRVPTAEYDRDPQRIEHQARIMVNAPEMLRLLRRVIETSDKYGKAAPQELAVINARTRNILRHIFDLTEGTEHAAE